MPCFLVGSFGVELQKDMLVRIFPVCAAIAALIYSSNLLAAYKCTGPDGKVTFTDQPCMKSESSEAIDIEAKKKRKSGYQSLPSSCSAREASREISIGMTEDEVYKTCRYPDDINRTRSADYEHEQWVYGEFPRTTYIYIENGVVTSMQD